MAGFNRGAPQVPVVLAFLVLWVSFAWGLPADAPATEGEGDVTAAEGAWKCDRCGTANDASAKYCMECGAKRVGEADVAPKDPWGRVRLSAAYDYAKCTRCGKKNQIRAESCSRCRNDFPQPSAEMTDPEMVFVPGKGYYREGTVVEPGKTRKGYWTTGLVLTAGGGLLMLGSAQVFTSYGTAGIGMLVPGIAATATGIVLIVKGRPRRTVYAFASGERYDPYERPAFTRRSLDSDGVAFKVEVTVLGF